MDIVWILLEILGAVIMAWIFFSGFFIVPQNTERNIEMFGKFVRTAAAGLNFKTPIITDVTPPIPLQLQQEHIKIEVRTKDNAFVTLPVSVQYHIVDAFKWWYGAEKPLDSLGALIINAVRQQAAGKEMNELFTLANELHEVIEKAVSEFTTKYGLVLDRIVVDQPEPSPQVKDAYDRVIASLRLREAAVNEGEAQKSKRILFAEAEAEAMKQQGIGLANMRKEAAQGMKEAMQQFKDAGITEEESLATLVLLASQDAIRDAAKSGAVVLSTIDSNSQLQQFGQLAAFFKQQGRPVTNASDKEAR